MYVNFTSEGADGIRRASYPPEIHASLQAVKDQYDPLNVFRFNINVSPTS
jgi:FAD/FMN-containing dehydrogenase